MKSSETEEITDEIIGEAVLALLKTNRPITTPDPAGPASVDAGDGARLPATKNHRGGDRRNLRKASPTTQASAFAGKENQWPLGIQRIAGAKQYGVGKQKDPPIAPTMVNKTE